LTAQVEHWRAIMNNMRPAALLDQILNESGLHDHYGEEPDRLSNLFTLNLLFKSKDDAALHPETALRSLLEFSSLAKNIDLLSAEENQVVAITIHQAKGLEFDTVFIAGAVDNELPTYFAIKNGDLEEEKRLFYVALTRAKERLFISGHQRNERGYNCQRSRFLREIDRDLFIQQAPYNIPYR
jgi:DNA helicase-2/ATP-dependent DNA helicase PcrA